MAAEEVVEGGRGSPVGNMREADGGHASEAVMSRYFARLVARAAGAETPAPIAPPLPAPSSALSDPFEMSAPLESAPPEPRRVQRVPPPPRVIAPAPPKEDAPLRPPLPLDPPLPSVSLPVGEPPPSTTEPRAAEPPGRTPLVRAPIAPEPIPTASARTMPPSVPSSAPGRSAGPPQVLKPPPPPDVTSSPAAPPSQEKRAQEKRAEPPRAQVAPSPGRPAIEHSEPPPPVRIIGEAASDLHPPLPKGPDPAAVAPEQPRLVIGRMRVEVTSAPAPPAPQAVRVIERRSTRAASSGPPSSLRFGLGQM